jgi:hypothetical protein
LTRELSSESSSKASALPPPKPKPQASSKWNPTHEEDILFSSDGARDNDKAETMKQALNKQLQKGRETINDTDKDGGCEALGLRAVMEIDNSMFCNLSACYIFDLNTNVSQPLKTK